MSEFGDLIPEFVEESLEHLKNIEEDIIIIEQGSADKELINRVFRAVHSIKGGSSFLGLKNIELLSHKMEDIFNLVRNDELVFSSEISSSVLKSIDKLKDMLEDSEESDSYQIEENLRELKTCLTNKRVDEVAEKMKEDIQDTTVQMDKHRFDALRKQGKKVFLIQFELKEEAQGGKNPLDFFSEIEKTGEIIMRNVDMELVFKDDGFTGEGIPLSILYASVLEKDLVAHIFGIEEASVKEIVPDSLIEEEVIKDSRNQKPAGAKKITPSKETSSSKRKSTSPDVFPDKKKGTATQNIPTDFSDNEFTEDEIGVRDEIDHQDDSDSSFHDEADKISASEDVEYSTIDQDEDDEDEDVDIDIIKDMNEYLTYWVGDEEYGINITQVHEIVTLHQITPVPGAEDYTKGVINLRGDILPVYDFRVRLKFEARTYDNETIILIVMIHGKKIGVIVDRVSEVIQLKREQITEAPQMQQIASNFVIGIGQKDGKFVILLKLKEIFRNEDAA